VVRTLADFLARNGCVSVVCSFSDGPLRAEIERHGIPVEILPERRYSVIAFPLFIREMIRTRRTLAALVKKYEVDVIQTHLLRSLDFLVLSLQTRAGPLVFWTFHNALFDLREDHLDKHKWLLRPKRAAHHFFYQLGSRIASGLIAVSEDVRKAVLDAMPGIPPEKISVISNRVDVSRYGRCRRRDEIRAALGFGDVEHLMTVVAILKTQKGHAVLLDALAKVAGKHPQLHVLIAGDGELRPELENRSRELHLESQVHFLGTRKDIPDLLSASDSFVLPSLWEGMPMALIEAMASGLPVVATDVSGTREVMVDGETGLMVPPGDPDQLAQAIDQILSNPAQADAMGAAGRRRVETSFSAQTQAKEYLALFERIQSSRTRRLVPISGE
jgi:glycosyltransferase involved in cell wall biosynthesis